MPTQHEYKEMIKNARDMVDEYPNKSAEELSALVAEEMIYPNRSNEKLVKELLFHMNTALQLALDHPNSLDGVLARKLEEKVTERHQQLLADPQLLAENSVFSLAQSMAQLLEMGEVNVSTWREYGDKIIESSEFNKKCSEKSLEEFSEVFMNIRTMEAQDGFAYIVENVSPDKNPSLYNDITEIGKGSISNEATPQAAKL